MKTNDILWEELPSGGVPITIKFREDDLNGSGRNLLDACRQQSPHLAALLVARDGVIHADLWDSEDTDDVIVVRVQSELSRAERMRRYGVAGLKQSDHSGEFGPQGPTQAYIERVGRFWGEERNLETRVWEVPGEIVEQVRRGELVGAAAINAIGAALVVFCRDGAFTILRDPDWVSQSEAAAQAGVSLNRISTAITRNKLSTWTDPNEPNPRQATRVRLSEVLRLWGTS